MLKVKRIYEAHEESDGMRVLVDRLWPRGLSKKKTRVDLWLKDITPSHELRKWLGHRLERWSEFQWRYRMELEAKGDMIPQSRNHARDTTVPLHSKSLTWAACGRT